MFLACGVDDRHGGFGVLLPEGMLWKIIPVGCRQNISVVIGGAASLEVQKIIHQCDPIIGFLRTLNAVSAAGQIF